MEVDLAGWTVQATHGFDDGYARLAICRLQCSVGSSLWTYDVSALKDRAGEPSYCCYN